jgi:two-component system, OmpR family, response regulator
MKILLVDGDPEMTKAVGSLLVDQGFDISSARSIHEATMELRRNFFDIALLDRSLPDGDGLSLVATFKQVSPGTRIIVISALDKLDETVSSLDVLVDDFVAKPFRAPELTARIMTCLQKRRREQRQQLYKVGDLTFDSVLREASVRGKPVTMDRREIALLEALIERTGRVITREILILRIYGENADVQHHTLDTLVWRLRRRLDEVEAAITVVVARGIGYMLTDRSE